jgi:predicted RNA-binding Zn-ribbon protein involved in translation (DUF1610 family)
MGRCPNCGGESGKPEKTWKYSIFTVQAYICPKCGTRYRDYYRGERHSFTLKREKGKGYVKV